jgi:hypothetical protein
MVNLHKAYGSLVTGKLPVKVGGEEGSAGDWTCAQYGKSVYGLRLLKHSLRNVS